LWPERVPRGIGYLQLAGQARGERVTAAGSGGITGQGAEVSLMCGAYLNGGADLG